MALTAPKEATQDGGGEQRAAVPLCLHNGASKFLGQMQHDDDDDDDDDEGIGGGVVRPSSSSSTMSEFSALIHRFRDEREARPRTRITKKTTPNQKLHPNYNCFAYKRRRCSGRRRTSAIYTLPQGNASSSYFSSSSNAYEIGSARCAGGLGRERNFKIIMILDFLEPALSLLSPSITRKYVNTILFILVGTTPFQSIDLWPG